LDRIAVTLTERERRSADAEIVSAFLLATMMVTATRVLATARAERSAATAASRFQQEKEENVLPVGKRSS